VNLPDPPHPFDPATETIAAGTVLYRVHEPVSPSGAANDGTVFNPGFGKATRFAFFGGPTVPVLYAADRPEAAVHEMVLHDAEPGSFVPRAQWQSKVLTALRVVHDFSVAALHSDGLRRFGLYPADLTDTDMTAYPRSVAWAQAAWLAGFSGVSYMSRHYNSGKALCLFGDRLEPGSLRVDVAHPDTRVFALPKDAEWLAALAAAIHVTIRP
jgi:hypothetical protein